VGQHPQCAAKRFPESQPGPQATVLLKLPRTVTGYQQQLALPGWASNFGLQRSGKGKNNLLFWGLWGELAFTWRGLGFRPPQITTHVG